MHKHVRCNVVISMCEALPQDPCICNASCIYACTQETLECLRLRALAHTCLKSTHAFDCMRTIVKKPLASVVCGKYLQTTSLSLGKYLPGSAHAKGDRNTHQRRVMYNVHLLALREHVHKFLHVWMKRWTHDLCITSLTDYIRMEMQDKMCWKRYAVVDVMNRACTNIGLRSGQCVPHTIHVRHAAVFDVAAYQRSARAPRSVAYFLHIFLTEARRFR
jgi:hypothetical protein